MRIAFCDNSTLSQILFIDVVREWDSKERPECFSTGQELLKAAEEAPAFDIVFLDSYLPMENGADIAAKLRKISPETGIVFIVNSSEHALDAYSLHALHYLVKPIRVEDVCEAFRRLESFRQK